MTENQTERNNVVIVSNQKSMGVTILLTILLGPLGMLYSTISGGIIMILVSIVVSIFTFGLGLFITWPICVIWGAVATNKYNERLVMGGRNVGNFQNKETGG